MEIGLTDSGSKQAPATEADPMPQPPREPALEECCGNGCDPCVFDLYDLEKARYREELKAWQARHAPASTGSG